jgi:hypothetical protein
VAPPASLDSIWMSFQRGIDGPDSVRPEPAGPLDVRIHRHRTFATSVLAEGTLACPECDAPIAPPPFPLSPADPLGCGFCEHAAAVRDFLSLAPPPRPARVVVRVRHAWQR